MTRRQSEDSASSILAVVAVVLAVVAGASIAARLSDSPGGAEDHAAATTTTTVANPTRSDSRAVNRPRFSALMDGQSVTVEVPTPSDRFGTPGVALCRQDDTQACTRLPHEITDVADSTVTVEIRVPRKFVTWDGAIHDCIDVHPCELRLWTGTNESQETGVPLSFIPVGPPADPTFAIAEPDGPYAAGDTVTVTFDGGGEGRVLQCVRGVAKACGAPVAAVRTATGALRTDLTLELAIDTAEGLQWCEAPEACELRFITSNARYVEPLPLSLQATAG